MWGNAKIGSGIKIPVKTLNANATFDCELSQSYLCRMIDTTRKRSAFSDNYLWIDQFPDIKSAVDHGTNEYECIQETKVYLIGNGFDLAGGNAEKKINLYISYKKK